MVFTNKFENSIFANEDDFGVDSYREDVVAIFNKNKIKVKLFNPEIEDALDGDFFGVNVNSRPAMSFIDIAIQSSSAQEDELEEEGYTSRGARRFNCIVPFDTVISSKMEILFLENSSIFAITSGQRFRIRMKDIGMFKTQYTFKSFELIAV